MYGRICLSLHVMSEPKHYIFNSKTLSYEVKTRSKSSRVFKTLAMFAVSLGMPCCIIGYILQCLGLSLRKRFC